MRSLLVVWVSLFCLAAGQLQCKQKLEPGPCRALFIRWGSLSGFCVEFIYGGCGGNSNNFRTKADCIKHCPNAETPPLVITSTLPPAATTEQQPATTTEQQPAATTEQQSAATTELPPGSQCQLKLEAGPCQSFRSRWGSRNGECVLFYYGGCAGNGNNFSSKKECEEACPATVTATATPLSTEFVTDQSSLDICQLPLVAGPCKALIHRWGSLNGNCVKFVYGGCEGNSNSFGTRADCEKACPPALVSPAPTTEWPPVGICQLPLETGPCRASFTRWGSRNGTCVEFTYGGCAGNKNNFRSRADCVRVCNPPVTPMLRPPTTKQTPVDRCQLPLETGPCRASFTRWGSRNGECVKFTYGGCDGNQNNFRSEADCKSTCHPVISPCTLPVVAGRCYAYFPRWASVDGRCKEFVYGGCGGNGNNFRTIGECEAACPSRTRHSPPAPTTELTHADRCQLPLETGPCRAFFTRWGSRNGTCVEFTYGGCGRNSNNFQSRADCVRACNPPVTPMLRPPTTEQTPVDRCQLPLETGPCRAFFTRWGSRNGECVEFTYGGCEGNENNFHSKDDCESSCPQTSKLCSLPVESGMCYAIIPRWASVEGRCKEFVYGGCGGNGNNFRTIDECEAACPSQTRHSPPAPTTDLTPVDRCQLLLETGPCKAAFTRWGSRNGTCVEFTYGGCAGNKNNFRSRADCVRACNPPVTPMLRPPTTKQTPVDRCQLPLEQGPCRASFTRWGSRNGECVEFTYGGCDGNENNFGSEADCKSICHPVVSPCTLPVVTGSCYAYFPRWASVDGQCKEFVYGGCGGNGNNFRTIDECEEACPSRTRHSPPAPTTEWPPVGICQLPLETGPCRASFTRWGSRNGTCVEFTYGGCGRNSNHFQSRADCVRVCNPLVTPMLRPPTTEQTPVERCQLPLETGPCRASFTRWGSKNGECVEFTYGGCDGNENNFRSKEDCEKSCQEKTHQSNPACRQPVVKGLCRGRFPSWGYQNGQCVNFIYGGCGGNENRFKTKEACERVCITNPPDTIRDLTPVQTCQQPLEVGSCQNAEVRWGSKGGMCGTFTYSGCGGNSNNFRSQAECESTCPPRVPQTQPPVVDSCQLPIITGPCQALLYRWGMKNGECVPFVYGGCDGNANNFRTKLECDQKCMKPTQGIAEKCTQAIAPGPCRARYPSWGYKDGKCVQFVYGGCRGNSNRFATKKGCLSQCERHSKPKRCTALTAAQGTSCLPGKLKWFYNREKDECVKSIHSVCKNTKYNAFFRTKATCDKLCKNTWP